MISIKRYHNNGQHARTSGSAQVVSPGNWFSDDWDVFERHHRCADPRPEDGDDSVSPLC